MQIRTALLLGLAVTSCSARAEFSAEDRDRAVRYWSASGRYSVCSPEDASKTGTWQVRLTPEGSLWLWNYNKARGLGKVAPTQIPAAQNDRQKVWESWIDAKVAWDRYQAEMNAAKANHIPAADEVVPSSVPAADPGPMPDDLRALAGEAPLFANAVVPQQHLVRFDDGTTISYSDNVAMRPRYAYYRFPQGVMSAGKPVKSLSESELNSLLNDAGIDESTGRVMKAVSMLEGGFDSVNTYDTGFVSVGFIQFACLSSGSGSLGQALLGFKHDYPEAFDIQMKRYGVDVDESGSLDVLDLTTGDELHGAQAARNIINDKRLIAVFQHAGMVCREFRVAQLKVARKQFLPVDDQVSISGADGPMQGKISDFIKSEAGLATLMDRKVNTGKVDPLVNVANQVAVAHGAKSLADLIPYEHDIVQACKYRKDYLADQTLTQPAMAPGYTRIVVEPMSRHAAPRKRHKAKGKA